MHEQEHRLDVTIVRTRHLVAAVTAILLGASVVSAGSSSGSSVPGEGTAHDFYLAGNSLFRDGQYNKATAAFRKSLELNSNYYYARVNLGVALAKAGRFREAAGEFTACIEGKWGSEEDRFVFHLNRSLALKSDGQSAATLSDRADLEQFDPARAEQLQGSGEYVLMDLEYMETRNQADMARLFARERAAIISGDVVIRKVVDPGNNEQEYEVIGIVDGKLEHVFAVLADYRNYTKFMPNVKEIVISRSDTDGTVVDHKLLFPMGFVKKYRLKFRLKSEQNRSQLFWRKLPWAGVKDKETVVDTYGQWILEALPGADDKVLAYYRVYTDTGNVPFGTAWLVEPMTKKSFQDMFKGTRRRVKEVYD